MDKNYVEYYSALEKKEILSFATMWMNLEGIMVNKGSQTKTKTTPLVIIYIWNLKKKKGKLIKS